MNRTEMVKARVQELQKLSDIELAEMIVKYFEENNTLPGEKALKDYATGLKAELDGSACTGLLTQVRDDLIEQFASLLVKEVRVKNVHAMNENKPNKNKEGRKASDLPMVLTDSRPIPVNAMKNTYEMEAMIGTGMDVFMIEEGKAIQFGELPKGFKKNHPIILGMKGTVLVDDYSNNKFANMSYRMLIDLGQWLAA